MQHLAASNHSNYNHQEWTFDTLLLNYESDFVEQIIPQCILCSFLRFSFIIVSTLETLMFVMIKSEHFNSTFSFIDNFTCIFLFLCFYFSLAHTSKTFIVSYKNMRNYKSSISLNDAYSLPVCMLKV